MNSFFLLFVPFCVLAKPKQPNILLILMDDLPYSDLGYLGGDIPTPTIDALATTGIRLNYHYAENVCSATRSALLTGRYAWKTMLNDVIGLPASDGINPDIYFISDVLSAAGYETLLAGKWHIGSAFDNLLPHSRGFDSSVYFTEGQISYTDHNYCVQWGMAAQDGIYDAEIDDPQTLIGLLNERIPAGWCGYDLWENKPNHMHQSLVSKDTSNQYSEDIWFEKIKFYLDEKVADPANQNPFFIYWSMQTPHTPLTIPPQTSPECDNLIGENRQIQCNMLFYGDLLIGEIIDDLKIKKLYDDTVIIFLSDNGAQVPLPNLPLFAKTAGNPLPFRGAKYNTFEGGIRTPAFINGGYFLLNEFPHFPTAHIGCDYNNLVYVSDFYSIITHLANIPSVGDIDGINIWPDIQLQCDLRDNVVNNNSPIPGVGRRDEIISFKFKKDDNNLIHRAYVRTNDYKLLVNPNLFGTDNIPFQFDLLENWVNYDGTEFMSPNQEYYKLYNNYDTTHFNQNLFYSQCYENYLDDPINNPIITEPYIDQSGNKIYLYKILEDNIEACNLAENELVKVNELMTKITDQIPLYSGSVPRGEKRGYRSLRDSYDCQYQRFFYQKWREYPDDQRWDDIFLSIIDTFESCPQNTN